MNQIRDLEKQRDLVLRAISDAGYIKSGILENGELFIERVEPDLTNAYEFLNYLNESISRYYNQTQGSKRIS